MSADKKTAASAAASAAKTATKSNDEIYSEFQVLRTEQRIMVTKLSEMEAELNEHKIVLETLKTIDPQRKCYRMVGGILCELTVAEVMPTLCLNREKLTKVIETLNEQLIKKGVEINEYKEKHKIHIRGQDDVQKQEESTETKRNAVVVNPIKI